MCGERGKKLLARLSRSAFDDGSQEVRLFAEILHGLLKALRLRLHRVVSLGEFAREVGNLRPQGFEFGQMTSTAHGATPCHVQWPRAMAERE